MGLMVAGSGGSGSSVKSGTVTFNFSGYGHNYVYVICENDVTYLYDRDSQFSQGLKLEKVVYFIYQDSMVASKYNLSGDYTKIGELFSGAVHYICKINGDCYFKEYGGGN